MHVSTAYVYFATQDSQHSRWLVSRILKTSRLRGAMEGEDCGEFHPGNGGDEWDADDRGVVVRTGMQLLEYPAACRGAPAAVTLRGNEATHIVLDGPIAYVVVDGRLVAVTRAGGAQRDVGAISTGWPAIGPDAVYWAADDGSGTAIERGAKSGGAPRAVAHLDVGPSDIAADGSHVYWVTGGDHSLYRAPATGGAAERLGALGPDQVSLVVDDASIYWVAGEEHARILRAAK
jgi:hypothetical protein